MITYVDSIPLDEFKNYKYVIYQINEYIDTGFGTKQETLDYYASKGEATLYVYTLPNYMNRDIYIETIGVK